MGEPRRRRILIIGTGFGGLGLAIRLKRAGIHSFTILEKAARLGGTWRENTYPGAACDVPSMLYCWSFEPKADWTRKWSPHGEIRQYMEDCTRRNGILPHIRFGVEATGARFDPDTASWSVRTTSGETFAAEVLVSAVGQLHHPLIPSLPGLDTFGGECFHSACWNHGYDLAGKRVAVIGNAASAIQFIPEIAPRVDRLHVFQRSANWMFPRGDRAYSARERWAYRHVPGLARLVRALVWLRFELTFYPLISGKRVLAARSERAARDYIGSLVTDPTLRAALVPDYPIGGKRILITDGYYEALGRDNVELVTADIDRLTADAVVTRDGVSRPVDAVILATGFRTNPFLSHLTIEGLEGRTLANDWAAGAEAYYGLTVAGYPNFFMLYGPNTNLGHNSIIFMMEAQARYIARAIRTLEARDLAYLDLRRDVMAAFNGRVQTALRRTAWAAAGASWYKDASGRITNNWPWTTIQYWWETRRLRLEDYHAVPRAASRATRDSTGDAPVGTPARAAAG
jgi:cation diffusion facilitator CzcD-associated flavoprotein CzcO